MGYQMPNVIKEVYLPYYKESISFENYKKLTGIDILEIFDIKKDSTLEDAVVRKPNCKYYIVVDNEKGYDFDSTGSYAIPNGVYEILAFIPDSEDVKFRLYFVPRVNPNTSETLVLVVDISVSSKNMIMANEL